MLMVSQNIINLFFLPGKDYDSICEQDEVKQRASYAWIYYGKINILPSPSHNLCIQTAIAGLKNKIQQVKGSVAPNFSPPFS